MPTFSARSALVSLLLFLWLPFPSLLAEPAGSHRASISQTYGKLPLSFEANRGQADARVKFLSRGSSHNLFLTTNETVLALRNGHESTVLRFAWAGGNQSPRLSGLNALPGVSNYLVGNNTSWRTGVPHYAAVRYHGIYPGIDLVWHGKQEQLEYDLLVTPGADPGRIKLKVTGADRLEIDRAGQLILHTGKTRVMQPKPFIYQQTGKSRQQIAGHYALLGKQEVGFVLGNYNRRKTLVIDPVLSYSTYLSGSNSEFGYGIAVDKQGHTYVTGEVLSSDFPTTFGTTQTRYSGSGDAFVTKLSSSGSSLVYSTYLGGSDRDFGFEIGVNSEGQAYVTGSTTSTDFPLSAKAAQPVFGGIQDAFVAKLSRSGRFLVYSTYLGGSGLDFGSEVVVSTAGNAYVVGYTQSTDFPVTTGAFQTTLGGVQDAFLTRLDPAGSPVYTTYLGGSADEVGIGIAVDTAGNAYAAGSTASEDFPISAGGFQTTLGGGFDAFVTVLVPEGSTSRYSTYLGGTNNDFGVAVAVNSAGNAYLTGSTASTDFPISTGAVQTVYGGGSFDGFVARLDAQGTTLQYSTYLGGSELDNSFGIALGQAGAVYVTGQTFSADFVTTSDAFKATLGSDDLDAFVTGFSATGTLTYSTYMGGDGSDIGSAIAMDADDNVYIAGYTESFNYPTTNGAFQKTLNGIQAAFVTKLTP